MIAIFTVQGWKRDSRTLLDNEYALLWIKKGVFQLVVNAVPTQIGDNTLACFCKKEIDRIIDRVYEGYLFNFSRVLLSYMQMELSATANSVPDRVILPERLYSNVTPEIHLLLSSLMKEYYTENTAYKDEILNCLMRSLILQVFRNSGFRNPLPYPPEDVRLVNRFLEMVGVNYIKIKKVAAYADLLCISPNYLNIKVKRISGYTASQHIQRHILTEAIDKMRNEGFGLKQVAYHLGYEDVAYFSKFFKKATGRCFTVFKMEAAR